MFLNSSLLSQDSMDREVLSSDSCYTVTLMTVIKEQEDVSTEILHLPNERPCKHDGGPALHREAPEGPFP